jgi:site-specific recombinase XerC
MEELLGGIDIADVRVTHLKQVRDDIQREAGARKVARAKVTGRVLRAYDPDAHGKGAAENAVRAMRFYFSYACELGLLDTSPALGLKAPRRPEPPERPLTEAELVQIWKVGVGAGRDRELDELLLTFLRHTAARREGALNLTLSALDVDHRTVTITEKFGQTRTLPLARDLLVRLMQLARSRGAVHPHDAVFRGRTGAPISRRHFNTLFDRIDRHLRWTEPLDVGAHWIRHTTLSDIAAVSDLRVASAYAGHAAGSLGVIGLYTKVTFDDLVCAYEEVFGPRG